ncbi:hypothetical protein EXU57_02115 [Segetibacter sp. 3557_3]|uniref:hypothetical protein n=1 Tax=Segetibacter sp. 3557_3 TaxID=2547429 RepID=UPI00105859C8|nr:hypothetical protein [Segetibacter sp. 3557_3]TDH28889.1 hypothetical protein EXU57_02115 [Segetibacter sp. 3557_3]
MKKLLTYIVLYAYLVMLVKPVLPIFSDLIAHTFYRLEHISVVHQHNGVYHVDKELEDASEDLPTAPASRLNFGKDITPHLVSTVAYEAQTPLVNLVHLQSYMGELSDAFTHDYFPPPRFVVN